MNTSDFIALFPTGSKTTLGPENITHWFPFAVEPWDGAWAYKKHTKSWDTAWKPGHVTHGKLTMLFFITWNILVVFIPNHRVNLPQQAHNRHVGYLLRLLCGLRFKITQWIIPAGVYFSLAGSTKLSPPFKRKAYKYRTRVTGAREMLGAQELQGARVL